MTAFTVGQRVRTTVSASAMWEGAPAAPAGSLGTITHLPGPYSTGYGVALDVDPDMPATYQPNEIAPAGNITVRRDGEDTTLRAHRMNLTPEVG